MSRGMKKYLPYASLIEQGDFINEMLYEKRKVEKPIISPDEVEAINHFLINYQAGQKVAIKYYEDGYIYQAAMIICRIDTTYQILHTNTCSLKFANILEINYP